MYNWDQQYVDHQGSEAQLVFQAGQRAGTKNLK